VRGYFYLFLFAAMSGGIVAGRYLPWQVTVACFLPFLLAALWLSRSRRMGGRTALFLLAFAAAGTLLSLLAFGGPSSGILQDLASRSATATVTGAVSSAPVESELGTSFFVRVSGVEALGRRWTTGETVLVALDGPTPIEGLKTRVVTVKGRVRVAGSDLGWLQLHGACCSLSASATGVHVDGPGGNPGIRLLEALRAAMCRTYRRVFTPRTAGFIEGVTLSKTDGMDPEIVSDLRSTGLSHIAAVSGLHVGSAAMLVLGMLLLAGAGRRSRFLGAAAAGFLVMGLASFRPSASRAFIMAGLSFGGSILGREHDSLAGLSIAGIVLTGMNPHALFDPGFQLSFSAALSIVLGVRNAGRVGGLRAALAVCAAAQLGVLPLMLLRGEGVPVTALLANLIVVPLIGPLLLMSWLVALITAMNKGVGKALSMVPSAVARTVMGVASTMARVPRAWPGGGPAGVAAVLFYLLAMAWLLKRARDGGSMLRPVVCALTAAAIVLAGPYVIPTFSSADRVIAFDIGEGDAILLQDHCGGTVLVDGGPDEKKVLKKLHERGVGKIDVVVASHPHSDHLAGLLGVLREVPVGRLLEPGVTPADGIYAKLLRLARQKSIPCTAAREGGVIKVSDATELDVLYAPGAVRGTNDDPVNDSSAVVMARVAGARVLLMGDIEEEGQAVLLGLHPDVGCDILKVPHQGAANAATPGLYDSAHPRVALISVQRGNRYGHPSARCLDLLEERGIRVFRTDEEGDIELSVGRGKIGAAP
jgi:competence protein ComEC